MLNSCLSSLFISKYQINPVIDVLWSVITFQLLPYCYDKLIRVFTCPLRKLNVINPEFILGLPEIVIIHIQEHFRQRVDLRNQFPDVSSRVCRIPPRSHITPEYPICAVKLPALQSQWTYWKRPHPNKVVKYDSTRWVMCTKVILVE